MSLLSQMSQMLSQIICERLRPLYETLHSDLPPVTDVALPYIYFFIIVNFKINKNIYKKLKPSVTSVTPIVKWLYKPLQVFTDICDTSVTHL